MNIYRQGDVDILPVDELPTGLKEKSGEEFILAYGEATGHSHVLVTHPGAVISMLEGFGKKYIKIQNGLATLRHPEHKALEIVPGTYEIKIEEEFDYFDHEAKRVID